MPGRANEYTRLLEALVRLDQPVKEVVLALENYGAIDVDGEALVLLSREQAISDIATSYVLTGSITTKKAQDIIIRLKRRGVPDDHAKP